jgi:hypothetical protein
MGRCSTSCRQERKEPDNRWFGANLMVHPENAHPWQACASPRSLMVESDLMRRGELAQGGVAKRNGHRQSVDKEHRTTKSFSTLLSFAVPGYDSWKGKVGLLLMSILSTAATVWQWPVDLLNFAARHQVHSYLDPLVQATQHTFPTARDLRVFLESDPEIRDDWHIVFEVEVPQNDLADYVEAQHRWIDELYRICPAPLVCTFRLTLIPLSS